MAGSSHNACAWVLVVAAELPADGWSAPELVHDALLLLLAEVHAPVGHVFKLLEHLGLFLDFILGDLDAEVRVALVILLVVLADSVAVTEVSVILKRVELLTDGDRGVMWVQAWLALNFE